MATYGYKCSVLYVDKWTDFYKETYVDKSTDFYDYR